MCWCNKKHKFPEVQSVYSSDTEIPSQDNGENLENLPEHVDNLLLNRDIFKNGILGFRYETKDVVIMSYTSVEAKTFCLLMRIRPI